jgi:Tol biopolymer transport system component/DNA-binding winged helix-turn-helix (wHTH) protein
VEFLVADRWRVRPDLNRIVDGETEHQVPDKFMQVLVVLMEHPGVVSRQAIFDKVWPDTSVVDESLTRAISSLRKLFDDDPKHPRIIETIPKKGYRLLATVTSIPASDSSPGLSGSADPSDNRWWPMCLAVGIAVVAVAGWWLAVRHDTRLRDESIRSQITALPGIEEYPALSPEGDRVAFVWDGGDAEDEGVFVQVIGAGPALRLTTVEGRYAFPAWSHDSRFISYARVAGSRRGIFMVPATGGTEIELVAAARDEALNTPAFSPDGQGLIFARRAVFEGAAHLLRKNMETGVIESLAPSSELPFGGYRPRFSPDGSHLAFVSSGTERMDIVITSADGSKPRRLSLDGLPFSDFAWGPGSNQLILRGGGRIRVVDLDGTIGRTLTSTRSAGTLSVAARHPILAFSEGHRERNIWRWTAATDSTEALLKRIIHSTAWDAFPSLSPDGQSIAFLTNRTGSYQLWVASRDGTASHLMAEIPSLNRFSPSWSPTGERIAVTAEIDGAPTTCIVEFPSGRTRCLPPPDGGETSATWSLDGNSVFVTRSTTGGFAIWRRPVTDGPASDAVPITPGRDAQAVRLAAGPSLFFNRDLQARRIWRCDTDGTNPEAVFTLDVGQILAWRVTADGLYVGYRVQNDDRTYHIAFSSFRTGSTTELVAVPGRWGFEFAVDPVDDRTVFFDRMEAVDSNIFAIEHY